MADEDKEKAEKVAAAKKRVGTSSECISRLRGGDVDSSSSASGLDTALAVVELSFAFSNRSSC